MFEHRSDKLASPAVFRARLLKFFSLAGVLVALALFIGISGYHFIARLNWIDSLLNASMILAGMGPVDTLNGDGAKIFASFYALFSGLVFIALVGIIFSPLIHRALHKFHLDEKDLKQQ
jgi:hypothetical protein